MAAPTLSAYQQSTWTDSVTTNEATPSISWSAGDLVLVVGATEDNATATLNTPTATGLTFNAVSGFPTNTGGNCKLYAWTATAGSSSSGAITGPAGEVAGRVRGIAAFVYSGSGGIGATTSAATGSTTTQSLTRTGTNSAVVQVMGEWSATTDVTVTWTPSGQTQRIATSISGRATFFVAHWGDQGASGTTSYGFSAGAGTTYMLATIEILGTGGGSASVVPVIMRQCFARK